ncbi:MAG TPA: hypothetical protein VHT31_03090, partial [Candidatus Acidoferrum sp.]|nr:hypothetical protein [Candidatus Acidoferrum sp.]
AEDGYVRGKVFPDGPWGPETHIQRGSITYDFIVPGDPLTPGWATPKAVKSQLQSFTPTAAIPKTTISSARMAST